MRSTLENPNLWMFDTWENLTNSGAQLGERILFETSGEILMNLTLVVELTYVGDAGHREK